MRPTRGRNERGLGLAEVMASVVLATIVLMGVFNSSFVALSASVQAEQSFDAENLSCSTLAELQQDYRTLGVPFTETFTQRMSTADYRVTRELRPYPGFDFCAEAVVTVNWKQGRLNHEMVKRQLIMLEDSSVPGGGP